MVLQMLHDSLAYFADVGLYGANVVAYISYAGVQLAERFENLAAGDGLTAVFASAGEHPDRCQDTDPHRPNGRNRCLHHAILYTHGTFFPPQ